MTSKREKQALKLSKEWINPQFLNGQGDKFFAKIPCKKRSQLALSSKAAKYIINLSIDLAASGDRASLINCQRIYTYILYIILIGAVALSIEMS